MIIIITNISFDTQSQRNADVWCNYN